jgi:hypothetical protein
MFQNFTLIYIFYLKSHNCVKELRKECKELTQLVSFTSQQFKVELKQMHTKLSELNTMIVNLNNF